MRSFVAGLLKTAMIQIYPHEKENVILHFTQFNSL
jgi:hypothetical protein